MPLPIVDVWCGVPQVGQKFKRQIAPDVSALDLFLI